MTTREKKGTIQEVEKKQNPMTSDLQQNINYNSVASLEWLGNFCQDFANFYHKKP